MEIYAVPYLWQDIEAICEDFENSKDKQRQFVQYLKGLFVSVRRFPEVGCSGRVPFTREYKLEGFPYILVYKIERKRIVLLRILSSVHTAHSEPNELQIK